MLVSFNSYGGWTEVASSSAGEYYTDITSLQTYNGYVYWWELTNHSKPVTSYRTMSHTAYKQGECGIKRHKILSLFAHKGAMGMGASEDISSSLSQKWLYSRPGSVSAALLNFACSWSK